MRLQALSGCRITEILITRNGVFVEVTAVHLCQTVLWSDSLPFPSTINPLGCKAAYALCTTQSDSCDCLSPSVNDSMSFGMISIHFHSSHLR